MTERKKPATSVPLPVQAPPVPQVQAGKARALAQQQEAIGSGKPAEPQTSAADKPAPKKRKKKPRGLASRLQGLGRPRRQDLGKGTRKEPRIRQYDGARMRSVNSSLPVELVEQLDRLADEAEVSRSAVIAHFVSEGLQDAS